MQVEFYALGTKNIIKVFQLCDKSVLNQVVNRVVEIEDMMSRFKPYSDISRLNQAAGKCLVDISKDTLKLLNRSLLYTRMSEGVFDITIAPLVNLWGIGKKVNFIPTKEEIAFERSKVCSYDIILEQEHSRAGLSRKGQCIDLGGIAKGFAADEVKKILLQNGISHAVINLGGNIVTLGSREDGTDWKIGIQNPLLTRGEFSALLSVKDKSIVTSASNERFFIKNGVRYHHIIDPRTGYPAQSNLLSVTVVADSAMDADALTTSLFIMGKDKGMELLEQSAINAVFITDKMEIFYTEGLKDQLTLRRMTSNAR